MSKEPTISHKYHAKKDRLEITIKHYALHKRPDRDDLIKHVLHHLEKGPALAKANAKEGQKTKSSKKSD